MLSIYNTLSRSVEKFKPIDIHNVGMYCCGPTVYDYAHIGNMRTYVFEDILKRALQHNNFNVNHVMNVTDIGHCTNDSDEGEDKIELAAKNKNMNAKELTAYYSGVFFKDIDHLNILKPDSICYATDYIYDQIEAIKIIEQKGLTYLTEEGLYFDTSKDKKHGILTANDAEDKNVGRVDLGRKKRHSDFALWRLSGVDSDRQQEWESPWGRGFPGWHIECTVMATKQLGNHFDIHCGGKDHIGVHHNNEITQCRACYGTEMANYWCHGYFLEVDGRMGKSEGNSIVVKDIIDKGIDPLAFRMLCLMSHYRSDMKFSWDLLMSAEKYLNRIRNLWLSCEKKSSHTGFYLDIFNKYLNDDLNTIKCLETMKIMLRDEHYDHKYSDMIIMNYALGLDILDWKPKNVEIPKNVQKLIRLRESARYEKNWSESDRLRGEIIALGFDIKDEKI